MNRDFIFFILKLTKQIDFFGKAQKTYCRFYLQEHFGHEVLRHCVVVLTHGKKFKSKSLQEYLDNLQDDGGFPLADTIPDSFVDMGSGGGATSKIAFMASKRKKISFNKFLKIDVNERVMAVENQYKNEYQRIKQRDVLIELIDVVVATNNGKCFRNKFFDIVQNRLKERDKKEDEAKKEFLQDEVNEYHEAKRSADEKTQKLAKTYIKEIQYKNIEHSIQRIPEMVMRNLEELKNAISTMIGLTGHSETTDPLENVVIAEETIREKNKETEEQANIHPAHRPQTKLQRRLQESKETLDKNGLRAAECELGLEYSLTISQLFHELNEEETSNFVDIHTMLLQHLKAFLDALSVMEEISRPSSQKPNCWVIREIIDKTVIKQMPLAVNEFMEITETVTWMKDLEQRQDWWSREFSEDKEGQSFLEKYCRKTRTVRQWAKEAAYLIMKSANQEDLVALYSSIYFDSSSKILQEMISLVEEKTVSYTKLASGSDEIIRFVSTITPDLLTTIAKEAIIETFSQQMTEQDKTFMDKRRKFMVREMTKNVYPCVSKVNNKSEEEEHVSEATRYEDARLHILYALEFLVHRCFRKLRTESLQRELQDKESRGKQDIRQIIKAGFQRLEHIVGQSDRTVRNSLELKCKQQLFELEGDLVEKYVLEKELEAMQFEEEEDEKHLIGCIDESVESLFLSVRNEIILFIRKKTPRDLKQLKANGYKEGLDEVSSNVEKSLGARSKAYFGKHKINKAVRIHAKVNQEGLQNIIDEVKCFPADATVAEKSRGKIKMSEVKVGDKLLTSSSDGTLTYQDVFMLGAF